MPHFTSFPNHAINSRADEIRDSLWQELRDDGALVISALLLVWVEHGTVVGYSASTIAEVTMLSSERCLAVLGYLYNRGVIGGAFDEEIHEGVFKLRYQKEWDAGMARDDFLEAIGEPRSRSLEESSLPVFSSQTGKVAPPVIAPLSPEKPQRSGTVYLVHAGPRYKIGITTNLKSRLGALNSGQSPYRVEVVHHVSGLGYDIFEKDLHQQFQMYRVRGEWFEFTDDQVTEVIRAMNEWGGDA
jgi:hypothetical protein